MAPNPTQDTIEDELLTALGLVVPSRINAALDLHNADAIQKVFLFPITLPQIPAIATPSMAIYKTANKHLPHGPVFKRNRYTIRLDYFAQSTTHDKLAHRWPLLDAVTVEIYNALCDGTWDSVPHLLNVGVKHIDPDKINTNFLYADDGSFAWPTSQTSIVLDWEKPDTTVLIAATELLAQQLRDDKVAADPTPFIVTSLHTLPPPP